MKITDLTGPTPSVPRKHIQLVACLQTTKTKTPETNCKENYFFYEFPSYIDESYTEEVARLAKIKLADGCYDLIAIYYKDGTSSNIYLGHWNDGTVASE